MFQYIDILKQLDLFMSRISRYKLSNDKLKIIFNLFVKVLTQSSSRKDLLSVLDYLLSPVEKIMIAKRVALLFLLTKDINRRQICFTLKVSSSTVNKYYSLIRYEDKNPLLSIIRYNIKKEKISGYIEDMLTHLLLQPGLKIGHRETLNSYQYFKRKKDVEGL